MDDFGIVILRHVSDTKHNKLWQESYKCARSVYPNVKIIIIDDNSNLGFVSSKIEMINCEIINSSYPGRGELLPYLYFLQNKWFKTMLFIHDSVFIQKPLDFSRLDNKYIPLWSFDSKVYPQKHDQLEIIKKLNNNQELIKYHNSNKWSGFFGGMTIITLEYLQKINEKHDIFNIIDSIKTRYNRMSFERVLPVLLHYNNNNVVVNAVNDDIFKFLKNNELNWGDSIEDYNKLNGKKDKIYKVWSGR